MSQKDKTNTPRGRKRHRRQDRAHGITWNEVQNRKGKEEEEREKRSKVKKDNRVKVKKTNKQDNILTIPQLEPSWVRR